MIFILGIIHAVNDRILGNHHCLTQTIVSRPPLPYNTDDHYGDENSKKIMCD